LDAPSSATGSFAAATTGSGRVTTERDGLRFGLPPDGEAELLFEIGQGSSWWANVGG
jgi:hypothetical protein